ncbi:MAG: hypothetical protein OXU20_17390 [Myxococcales bacterium]|nr:hypothetical protein [Myxococcales bacterium]
METLINHKPPRNNHGWVIWAMVTAMVIYLAVKLYAFGVWIRGLFRRNPS